MLGSKKYICCFLAVFIFVTCPLLAQDQAENINSFELSYHIMQDARTSEIANNPDWEEGLQELIDSWHELQILFNRPDALEAIARIYRAQLTPNASDSKEERVRLVFAELLLQKVSRMKHQAEHENHEEGIEERITFYLNCKAWDKLMAGYEKEYFTFWPEHGVRQDRIRFFYSAFPAMAYRAAVTKGYRSQRDQIVPPGPAEDMSTSALIQIIAFSPGGAKIWNRFIGGQWVGNIRSNWYQYVRETDAARELMMFREEAPQALLRYYQSLQLTDENYRQLMNAVSVCEVFLRQEFVSNKLSNQELAERNQAFADQFIQKLRYRHEYDRADISQWIAYEDMDRPLILRRFGNFYISELKAMPFLALQVMKRAI